MYQVKYIDNTFLINLINDTGIIKNNIKLTLPSNKYFNNDIINKEGNIISSQVRENVIIGYLSTSAIGYFGKNKNKKKIYKATALNYKLPNFRVPYNGKLKGKLLVIFKFIHWKEKLPTATIIDVLGFFSEENIIKAYIYYFGLSLKKIKINPINNILEATISRINDEELFSISIDPNGSKDIDDAISMDDKYIYIHIAQPISYMNKKDIIDISSKRFSTLYLGNKEISLFGNNITKQSSLIADNVRNCYTLKFNILGELINHYPGTVCLNKNLSYQFVNDNKKQFSKLFEFSKKVFNNITSAQKLVENWMIHTNCCIGNILDKTIYRKNVTDITLLDRLDEGSKKYFYDSSEYIYSSEASHTILKKMNYLHFTSPIRRMVDNFIHYQLTYKSSLIDDNNLEQFIIDINRLSKNTSKFHRTLLLRKTIKSIDSFEKTGTIVGIFNNYINILIPELGIFRHYIMTRYGEIINKDNISINQDIKLKLGLVNNIFPYNMLLITTELDNYLI